MSLVSFFLILTPLSIISYLIPIFLLTIFWPKTKLLDSWIIRLLFVFIITLCFQQAIGLIFWIVKIPFGLPQAIASELLLVLCLIIFTYKSPHQNIKLYTRNDITSLLVALVSTGLILGGILLKGPLMPQLLRFTTTGFDHTIHLSVALSVYDNKGYTYGPTETSLHKIIYRDLLSYPEGWHLNSSIIWQIFGNALDTSSTNIKKTLFLYTLTLLFWYGMLLYLFCRLVLIIINLITGSETSVFSSIGAIGFTVFCQAIFLLGMLRYGFSSFLPILLLTLVVVLLVIEHETKSPKNTAYTLLILSLTTSALTLSWLLSAPIGFLPIILIFVHHISSKPKLIWNWIKTNWLVSIMIVVLLLITITQLLIQLKFNQKTNQLNESGGIGLISFSLVAFASFISFIGIGNLKNKKIAVSMWYSLAASFLLTGTIFAYQYYSAMKPSYYAIKIGYISLIILMVFFSAVVITYLEKILSYLPKGVSYIILVAILIFFPYIFNIDMPELSFATGKYRKLSPYSASQISSILLKNNGKENNIIVLKGLDYEEDLVTTHFLQILTRKDNDCKRNITWNILSKNTPELFNKINACSKLTDEPYIIIASSKNYEELVTVFKDNSKVQIVLSS